LIDPHLALGAAMVLFVGSHWLLSHPLRTPAVRILGRNGFQAVYSLIALAALLLVIFAYKRAPAGPTLWNGMAAVPWLLTSLLTILAMALLIASLGGNPALSPKRMNGLSARTPHGVFRVTRHPMLFAIAIWALSHLLVAPSLRALLLDGGLALMAVGGARAQDAKFTALYDREWRIWCRRAPFWPNLRALAALGWTWAIAVVAWLGVTGLHWLIARIPAGAWALALG
jgi:hypothetical protein